MSWNTTVSPLSVSNEASVAKIALKRVTGYSTQYAYKIITNENKLAKLAK